MRGQYLGDHCHPLLATSTQLCSSTVRYKEGLPSGSENQRAKQLNSSISRTPSQRDERQLSAMTEVEVNKRLRKLIADINNAYDWNEISNIGNKICYARCYHSLPDGSPVPLTVEGTQYNFDVLEDHLALSYRNATDIFIDTLIEIPLTPYSINMVQHYFNEGNTEWLSSIDIQKHKFVPTRHIDIINNIFHEVSDCDDDTWIYNASIVKVNLSILEKEINRLTAMWVKGGALRSTDGSLPHETEASFSATGNLKAKSPANNPKWPDQKTAALYYAIRWAVEKSSEFDLFDASIAKRAAAEAGFDGKGADRRLKRYFYGYRNRDGRTGEGARDTELRKRYDHIIDRLSEFPDALALAREERELVRKRLND